MKEYKFNYKEKEYVLNLSNCSGLLNDEEKPVDGVDVEKILDIISDATEIDFDMEYYQERYTRSEKEYRQYSERI